MKNQLVYDLPIRIFHWLFASLFITAFLIAKNVDDESAVYSYHMLAGLLLGFTVLLRIIWGFVGTKYSRFDAFSLRPKDLALYFGGILSGDKRKWTGHNPASGWVTFLMFALALSLGLTGVLMTSGYKETFEDIHELLANGFLIVVLMHVAGVVLHAFRHKDGIGMAMIDGQKKEIPATEGISNSRPGAALLFLGLVVIFATYLAKNFDSQNRSLNFFGTTLQLGENEDDKGGEHNESAGANRNDDDDDE
jgi:cytochrome b